MKISLEWLRQYVDYQDSLERLEEITEQLESGDTSLEDGLGLYTEGLEIAKFCGNKLDEAEKKIKIIAEKSGIYTEEGFDTGEETD